jgi:UDP-N-acetylglucosamine 2-epimerase (non-hydrolysing)
VVPRLAASFDHVLVHTGQNWDYRLNGLFFDELGLAQPDHVLDVDTSSLGSILGDTMRRIEPILELERPDAFLVLGDTNSAVSALLAKRMHIPVYHMEAGNRSFDHNVPEEANRRFVDHIADFNLVYTEHARRNLLGEGVESRRILLTGSPMREVLTHYAPGIASSCVLDQLELRSQEFILVSAHRQETVDNPARLRQLLRCLESVHAEWALPVVVSTHPRTRQKLDGLTPATPAHIRFLEPFGFLDYCRLQSEALCVLSDSGTISEESAILRFPAITLRSAIERPEALDTGSIIMTGLRSNDVIAGMRAAIDDHGLSDTPVDYLPMNVSVRVRNFIQSTAPEHHSWSGLL